MIEIGPLRHDRELLPPQPFDVETGLGYHCSLASFPSCTERPCATYRKRSQPFGDRFPAEISRTGNRHVHRAAKTRHDEIQHIPRRRIRVRHRPRSLAGIGHREGSVPRPGATWTRFWRRMPIDRAVTAAMRALDQRMQSGKELRTRLQRKGFEPITIDAALQRLSDHGYLNDERFAELWIENRLAHRPRGKRMLEQELRQKGIDREIVQETVAGMEIDDRAAALALANKRLNSVRALPPDEQKEKTDRHPRASRFRLRHHSRHARSGAWGALGRPGDGRFRGRRGMMKEAAKTVRYGS